MGLRHKVTPDFQDIPFAVPNDDWWAGPPPSIHSRLWADIMHLQSEFSFFQLTIPPINSQTLHGANTRTGRCYVHWLVYSVPSNVCQPASSPHMAPHPRAFFGHEATNGIDMQCMRSKVLSILMNPLIEHGSHGRIVNSYQTSLRAGN